MQLDEEVLKQILEYLWQQHVISEQQWIPLIVAAPLIGLITFIVLWRRHRAHVDSLLDAILFFFVPKGPERMMIFKDVIGNRIVLYDYSVVKSGRKCYIVQAGPYLIRSPVDPDSIAEPVSLLDAKAPPGIPSPFGLFIRQLAAMYITIAVWVIAFSNTFWTTMTVYVPVMKTGPTMVDMVAVTAVIFGLTWLLSVIYRAFSPQTLLTSLVAVGVAEDFIDAVPPLDAYSKAAPHEVLRHLDRKVEIRVPEGAAKTVNLLVKEIGDESLAASLVALLGQVYNVWKRAVGTLLAERYDLSVAARARYLLEREKLPTPFVQRYAGLLALIAIAIAATIAIIILQPSVHVINTTATTPATIPSYATPAPPPPPPNMTNVTVTPAQPPPPPGGG